MGRAWPRARPSTAHRQGEAARSFQQVGRPGREGARGTAGPGAWENWSGWLNQGCPVWGHRLRVAKGLAELGGSDEPNT